MTIEQMIENLAKIDDLTWGKYNLEDDILFNKIPKDQFEQMVIDAIDCGKNLAKETIDKYNTSNVSELCELCGVKLDKKTGYKDPAGRLIFALFTPPNKIMVSLEPIEDSRIYSKMFNEPLNHNLTKEKVTNLIIGHELFHYLEEANKKTIYTFNKKIVLWKLFNFKYTSRIRTLSEIAAMSFTKELNKFPYSPFLLDTLLLWKYDVKNATYNYDDIVTYHNKYSAQQLDLSTTLPSIDNK